MLTVIYTITVMAIYSPLFGKITDSSLWDESDLVIKVFLTMIAKQDADHIVRGNAYNIGRWARKSEEETMKALKVLSSPDTKRKEPQAFDGRRIERVPEGWLLINGQHYQDLMQDVNRRARQRKNQAAYRARKNGSGKPLGGMVDSETGDETPGEGSTMRGIDDGTIDPETLGPIEPSAPDSEPRPGDSPGDF